MSEFEPKRESKFDIRAFAYGFCEDIKSAAELTDMAIGLADKAQQRASTLTQRTMLEMLPFSFKVTLEPESDALVTVDDDVVEQSPTTFFATEVRSISRRGVEFYDRANNRSLIIDNFAFDISPVFEQPVVD
jgi:hypothetical protein